MRPVDELLRATARAEARPFWFRGAHWFAAPLVRRAVAPTPGSSMAAAEPAPVSNGSGASASLTVST